MGYLASYINTKSLTFWSAIAMIGLGSAQLAGVQNDQIPVLSALLAGLTGSGASDPVSMITMGFGLLGVRRKLEEIGK